MPSDNSRENNLLDSLAEDFVARYRRGERPSISEFAERHPVLADEIRDLFSALVMMEEARPAPDGAPDAAHAVHPPKHLERVGEYRILREVGRGGMGIVYEAEQESLSRHVAVKVLPTQSLLEPRFLQRFKLEARAAARLHHTNIVPVFGVGEDHGLNYYVMQFIQGRGLDEVLVELRRLRAARGPSSQSNVACDGPDEPAAGWRESVCPGDGVSAEQIASGLLSGVSCIPASGGLAPPPMKPAVPTDSGDRANQGRASFDEPSGNGSGPAEVTRLATDRESGHVAPSALTSSEHPDRSSSRSDSGREYWRSVARIGAQVADALAYAHSQGVLHRDIKPSNLLLDTQGTVWVTDFGLAKETAFDKGSGGVAQVSLTRTGDVVGTLRYMAPERLKGVSDQGGDIYSLGSTLYELLTLQPPFEESDRSVLVRRLLHDEPPRPKSIDPAIPLDLETIVGKAMAKEPSDRYRLPAELADDLRCFLADRPIHARRVTVWERAWRFCRRNRLVTSLSTAVILLASALAVGAVIAGWIRSERDQALTNLARAERAEADSRQNLVRAQTAERDARIRAHLTQAIVHRKRGMAGHRARSLHEIDQALALRPAGALRDELRNELIASLAHTDLISLPLCDYWGYPAAVDIDPNYERYARMTREGCISVRRVADNQELLQLNPPPSNAAARNLLLSPDGNYLASFSVDKHVLVWELHRGTLVLDAAGHGYAFDFTPDSRSLLTVHENECVLYDLATATVKSRWPTESVPSFVSCDPAGDRTAIAVNSRLQICSSANGQCIREWIAPQPVFDVAWHPDGTTVAVGCGKEIHLWDLEETTPSANRTVLVYEGTNLEFSHDGSLLACTDWGTRLTIWDYPTGIMLCSAQGSFFLDFSSDDRWVGMYQDGPRVGVRQIVRSDVFRHVVGGNEEDLGVLMHGQFSPDGRLLAIGTTLGLGFWEFNTGRKLAFAPIGWVQQIQFDGNSLLTSPMLRRWSIRDQDAQQCRLVIGPPKFVGVESPYEFAIDGDGSVMAAAQIDGAVVIHSDRPDEPIYLRPHYDCRYVAIDRQGHWVATGSHWGSGVKVWDANTGVLVRTLPAENISTVNFSPDGQWLSSTGYGPGLWRVGSWEPGPPIDGKITGFSPDSRLLVVEDSPDSLILIDLSASRTLARLEHPSEHSSHSVAFSPDGTTLAGLGTYRSSGFAWNLRNLRKELSARGLDWDLPPYPPPAPVHADTGPLQVRLITAPPDHRSEEEAASARIEQYRAAYTANPADATACNQLAWALVTSPESLRRPEEAVGLAEKAAGIQPNDANIRNTLGVAYYRAGRFRDAAECLAANLAKQEDIALAYDLYFLAMSHYQLGESERAREYFILAGRWTGSHMSDDALTGDQRAEMDAFRTEAEDLLSPP